MRTIFFGTPEEAADILRSLLETKKEIVAVVTQPDRPKGRGLALESSPVKQVAQIFGLPIFQPEKLGDSVFERSISFLDPDIGIVVAYGKLIPKNILDIPKLGFFNLHASLLPRYRGAAPVQWALINGEKETGVTVFKLVEALDAGDMIAQEKIKIDPEDTAATLGEKLFAAGKKLLIEALDKIELGKIKFSRQDGSKATLAPKISKELGSINFKDSAKKTSRLVRGLTPHPGAYTFYKGKLLKIFKTEIKSARESEHKEPGTVVELVKNIGFEVISSDKNLLIKEVQPEGGRRMSAWDFVIGHRLKTGDILPS